MTIVQNVDWFDFMLKCHEQKNVYILQTNWGYTSSMHFVGGFDPNMLLQFNICLKSYGLQKLVLKRLNA